MTHFSAKNVWLPRGNPGTKAAVRLFCFHHAGGSAAVYREWQQWFPQQIQVCPVEIPGHGTRMRERALSRMADLIEAMEEGLGPWLNQPFAFFGHSMGAAIAYELAQRLRARRGVQPLQLFLASRRGPGRPVPAPISGLPERLFVNEIRRLNGTSEEVLSHAEALAFVLPMLRSDFALIETHVQAKHSPLECPVAAFGGLDDHTVSHEDLHAWREASRAPFYMEMLPGDHFFVASSREKLIQTLSERLIASRPEAPAVVAKPSESAVRAAAPRLPFEREAQAPARLATLRRSIPAALLDQVADVAEELTVSVESALFATWQALLWRLSRQPVVATEVMRLTGPLSVRSEIDEDTRFMEIARACEGSIASTSRATREENADLDYLFSYAEESAPSAAAPCKLHFRVHGADLEVAYDSNRFRSEDVATLAEQYLALLEGATRNAQAPAASLPMNGAAHRELLSRVRPSRQWPMAADLTEQFEQRAQETPGALAAVCGSETLTYRELNARANQLARYLRDRGVGTEVRVGLFLERSCEMLIAILAVLKAGGTYVPVDPGAPRDRLLWIMQNSRSRLLLSDGATSQNVGSIDIPVIDLAAARAEIALCSDESLPNISQPQDAAYVLHTSGSTGQPKGVCVTRHNVARLFQCTEELFRFSSADVWSVCHSYAFDYSVWEIWGAWLYGGKVVLASRVETRSPEQLYELLEREKVTILSQTPAGFRALLQELQRVPTRTLRARAIVFGGEALDPGMLRELRERCPEKLLVNMYGITETTVHSTYKFLSAQDTARAGRSPIGFELPDTRIYVLNPDLQEAGLWETGEVFIGGPSVARCYVGRPDLTAERFVPEPDSPEPGLRMYRSGDLARRLSNGELEYVGRRDHQVKIRGYRIELGEIEAALRKLDGVRDAAVLLREDGGEKRLVAYVFNKPGQSLAADNIRQKLRRTLPDYMIPATFMVLDAMPLTSNGKLDRRALPEPGTQRPDQAQAFIAPGTGLEEAIAGIWAQELRVESVGAQDNFFEIGGHSLLLLQVHERLRTQLGLNIDAIELFAHPSVRSLAQFIAGQSKAQVAAPSKGGEDEADRRRAARRRREARDAARTAAVEMEP